MSVDRVVWAQARRILCLRLDNMGDVIMTTPALRALKALHPGVSVTLLTSPSGAAVAPLIPAVDELIVYETPWVRFGAPADPEAVRGLVERLQAGCYDAAVLFNTFSQSPFPAAMLCYLAEIPRVLAYARENPYELIPDWVPDWEPFGAEIVHEVQRQLHLVEQVGAVTDDDSLSLSVPESAQDAVSRWLADVRIALDDRWLVLHPGVSEAKRRYPPEKFIDAGRQLVAQGWRIVVTGSSSEKALADQVAVGIGGISTAGQFSVAELAALIAQAPLLIANNTGPVHIAAAVGTPVVVLYAHTNPQHKPWRVPSRVLYFDVPPDLRSRNVILQHVYNTRVPQPVIDAAPRDIVAAAEALAAVRT